jgi:energy-coupling factor transporter ATP-binding protein EcfA2
MGCAQIEEEIHSSDIIIGNTGAGKSTLVNCLIGVEMHVIDISNGSHKKILSIDLKSKHVGQCAEIGHTSLSTTSIPQAYKNK